MSTIRGDQSAQENFEEIQYSQGSGVTRRGGFTGPKEAVKPMMAELIAAGKSFTFVSDQSPLATIRYELPGQLEPGSNDPALEQPTTVWEYFANAHEVDLLQADVTAVNNLTDKELSQLSNAIVNPPTDSPVVSDNANDIYDLIKQGVKSFRVNAPTLRVTRLVSGSYTVRASLTNVGSIISTATLESTESIPGTILFNLPSYDSNKDGFEYAWYKRFPNVRQAGNKWEVSQEWEYGLYPTVLYGSVL